MLLCFYMHYRSLTLPLLAGVLLFGAGCRTEVVPTETSREPAPAPPIAVPSTATNSENCDNPYYPLRLGTKASYASSAGNVASNFHWEVSEVTADHATLKYTFSHGLSMDSEISCGPDGLLAKSYLNMGSLMAGSNVKAKTISSSGQFLPRDLSIGSQWTSTYEVETENDSPDAARLGMRVSHMTLQTESKALGEESVTVPAGTFTAIKVETKNTMKMKLSPTMPEVKSNFTTYSYFARGKGLIKSQTDNGSFGSSKLEATEIRTP